MNTPAHVVLNALVLGHGSWRPAWLPITAGALMPDLPMVAFYAYERGVLGTPESVVWSHTYYQPGWQLLFDAFSSLPLLAVAALLAWRAGAPRWLAFFSSMLLHGLTDLPLHHDDAHAHFLPFTAWRFESPVSYWDPDHHGRIFAAAEAALVLVGSLVLAVRYRTRPWRIIGAVVAGAYAVLAIFAAIVWGWPVA